MRSHSASAFGLLAGMLLAAAGPAAARPDIYARSQQIRRQNAQDCLEDLEDILDNAPTTSMSWGATACDYTSTLSGAELTATYASFRNRMSSWYTDDLDDITKLEASCTQYASLFSQIRYCYVTGPVPTVATSTTASSTAVTRTTTSTGTGGGVSTATVTTTATPDGGSGLDDGAKAGLAIGIIIAVLLLMFLGYKVFMKYREKRLDAAAAAAAAATTNGNVGPEMGGAAAAGAMGAASGGAAAAAALAAAKSRDEGNSVHAYKSELGGQSRPMYELDPSSISELDPGAAVAVPRTTGVHRHFAELDPTQISELPADNYDPTLNANSSSTSSPPPAYVSPVTDTGTNGTLYSVVSPVSPDSEAARSRQGLGISTISEAEGSPGADGHAEATPAGWTSQNTVQQGFGRGWMPKTG
ncbi:hypothetical protein CH35J_006193 [Colletotrichum higginsianum]|uniref:Lpxtg-domain-containing protein n=1 Tax=Colletotrichum higginsianum TaxID=80884 RepID=A0A4T0W3J1_9PEZI|nr:hypothetical protein CH35J_006193 [Colletotrichum higginsianum]